MFYNDAFFDEFNNVLRFTLLSTVNDQWVVILQIKILLFFVNFPDPAPTFPLPSPLLARLERKAQSQEDFTEEDFLEPAEKVLCLLNP